MQPFNEKMFLSPVGGAAPPLASRPGAPSWASGPAPPHNPLSFSLPISVPFSLPVSVSLPRPLSVPVRPGRGGEALLDRGGGSWYCLGGVRRGGEAVVVFCGGERDLLARGWTSQASCLVFSASEGECLPLLASALLGGGEGGGEGLSICCLCSFPSSSPVSVEEKENEKRTSRPHESTYDGLSVVAGAGSSFSWSIIRKLGTLDLQLPLPLVLQDVCIGLPVELTLQPLAVLLVPLAAALIPRPLGPQAGQVALHIAIGAAAPRSCQANPI
ncbi:hypothetical protein F7725_002987, partial [Dissostichus mawsoni]